MSRIGRAISEMTGRIQPKSSIQKMFASFWGSDVTVKLDRSDYRLFEAIYHGSVMQDGRETKGAEYLLGSAFAKPIVNIITAFTIGLNFSVTLDGAEEGNAIQAAQDKINQWIDEKSADFYNIAKYGFRGGDSFMVLHDDFNNEFLDPPTTVVVYDATSGGIIGYDVEETIEQDLNEKITFVRKYRHDSFVVTKSTNGNDPVVIVKRVYTTDGIVDLIDVNGNAVDQLFDPAELAHIPLPIFHFANEVEPKSIYGLSDLQNVLVYMQAYSKVLQGATKSNIYNATPIPVISGDKNDGLLDDSKSQKVINWGRNMVLYLRGDNASAKFMTVPDIMTDTGKLLEIYFYLIVQSSETPEFLLGNAINGSKASAETQLPIMIKKAIRKRAQLKPILQQIVESYMFKQYVAGDQDFYAVRATETDFKISFPDIVGDDKKITIDMIKMLVDEGIVSDKTAISMLNITQITDIDDELERAREDADRRESRTGILPDNEDKITNELDGLDENGDPIEAA